MRIIQISDFHVCFKLDRKLCTNMFKSMAEEISKLFCKDEKVAFCICGDFINKGSINEFPRAREIVEEFLSYFRTDNLTVMCVPGNHDIYDASKFELFDSNLGEICSCKTSFATNSVSCIENDEFSFILCNSSYHGDIDFGKINAEEFAKACSEATNPIIVVMHHSLFNENDNDPSALRNAYRILDILDNKAIAILHGHTHGYKKCVLGTNTWLIGVGPFTKDVPAVSPQANVIEISPLGVEKVLSYRYNADIDKTWSQTLAENPTSEFSGHSLAKVYRDAVLGVKSASSILNFKMKVHLPYDQFCKEIRESFGDKISIAQDWQAREVPASLYYNHGQYIWKHGNPIEFLYNELIKKPTSSRAVIPLINFGDVINSKDNFLPSFDLLQFGYPTPSDRTLNIILYLRALEVNHFLKINLCELYLIIKSLQERMLSITHIAINVYAFRAQYKEEYGCFHKAKFDNLDSGQFVMLIVNNEWAELIDLLREKKGLSETVIQTMGFIELVKGIKAVIAKNDNSTLKHYLTLTENICDCQKILIKTREHSSDYSVIEKNEYDLNVCIDNLIDALKKGE